MATLSYMVLIAIYPWHKVSPDKGPPCTNLTGKEAIIMSPDKGPPCTNLKGKEAMKVQITGKEAMKEVLYTIYLAHDCHLFITPLAISTRCK